MKILILVVTLMSAPALFAQEHASLADQKACYEQAQRYVKDVNAKLTEDHAFNLRGSHYDPKIKVCYVRYEQETSIPTALITVLFVDDAFEGNNIAMYAGQYIYSDNSEKVTTCQVNGDVCESRPEFNGLLWKLIPAFRSVQAHDVK